MNLTVYQLGSQSQRWLRIETGLRRAGNCSLRGRAQSHQPIAVRLDHPAPHEGTLPLMETTLSDTVIVPDDQHGQHAGRKCAMHRQIGAQHALPILDGATGTHGRIPGSQQGRCHRHPVGWQTLEQRLGRRTQDGPSWPGPAKPMQGAWPQRLTGFFLQGIQPWRKEHQMRQGGSHQGRQACQIVLRRERRPLD